MRRSRLMTPRQLSLFSISPVIGAWWEELQAQKRFKGSKPAVNELDQQLIADGLRHKQVLMSKLEKEGRRIARLSGKQTEADSAATSEVMAKGVEFIQQASHCKDEISGNADLLKRINHPALQGEWNHSPFDYKLAIQCIPIDVLDAPTRNYKVLIEQWSKLMALNIKSWVASPQQ